MAAQATATSAAGMRTSQTGPGRSTKGGGKNAQIEPAATKVDKSAYDSGLQEAVESYPIAASLASACANEAGERSEKIGT